jgi:hypothetical protein
MMKTDNMRLARVDCVLCTQCSVHTSQRGGADEAPPKRGCIDDCRGAGQGANRINQYTVSMQGGVCCLFAAGLPHVRGASPEDPRPGKLALDEMRCAGQSVLLR